MKFKVVGICSVEALSAIPKEAVRFDLDVAADKLESAGYQVENIGVMVTITLKEREVTVYRNGRITIYPAESKEIAHEIAATIYEIIDDARDSR
jgi:TATA-box binding protein (TBP) (component of TFIID and TFIIIB)